MIVYTVAMVVVSLVLVPVAGMTWIYSWLPRLAARGSSRVACGCSPRAPAGETKLRAMRLFRDSITYLTVVFAAILVDPFLPDTLTVWHC